MKIRKYQKLCEVCDQILTKNISNPQIVANNYLHVLNSHPDFLKRYKLSNIKKALLSLRFTFIYLVRIINSLFESKCFFANKKNIKCDILFVSHLTNEKQLFCDRDTYFGNLSNQLIEQGMTSGTALINHTNVSNRNVLSRWKGGKVLKFLLSRNLDLFSEIKLYFSQKKSKKQLINSLKSLKVDKTLIEDIICNHLSSDTFNALRIASQVSNIAKKINAKYVVTTFEGYAWERLVYYYVRKANPRIKCLGYQHAAVSINHHAIRRPLNNEYDPDVFLTSGLLTKKIFHKNNFNDLNITCIGSPKYLVTSSLKRDRYCCLVVPEGIISECLLLFKFSMSYAKKYPKQKFIWRLHPLLNFKRLRKYSNLFKKIPNNIQLSEASLDEDILKCDSVLYRGSTAVFNAINGGLKPIYYKNSINELSFDPIFQQLQGKGIVQNHRELSLELNKALKIRDREELQYFAQNFYTPLDLKAFIGAM